MNHPRPTDRAGLAGGLGRGLHNGLRARLPLLACWTLLAALPACNLARGDAPAATRPSTTAAALPFTRPTTDPSFHVDMKSTLAYLASDDLEGRRIGTAGNDKAAVFIAETFGKLGLEPVPGQGGYFVPFITTTGVVVADRTFLAPSGDKGGDKDGHEAGDKAGGNNWLGDLVMKRGETFGPLTWSGEGKFDAPAVFAGYAISSKDHGYDDFADIDVKGKVVLAMRFEPHDENGVSRFTKKKDEFSEDAHIPSKAKAAADHGAAALLLVTPPSHHEDDQAIMPFARNSMFSRAPIPVIQVSQPVAEAMLKAGGLGGLAKAQEAIDKEGKPASAALKGVAVKGEVALDKVQTPCNNVAAVLPGKGPHADEYVIVGAHYDHLGRGGPGSLAPLSKEIHHGADDNGSGTTAILALADHFAHAGRQARTLLFVAFSGEEEGLFGSQAFVDHPPVPLNKVAAMLNLDMVGRLNNEKLMVGGTGTAPAFEKIVESAAEGSPLKVQSMGKGGVTLNAPSDHISFATKKVPILFFFTGVHRDYHRPTDTADKINYDGMQQIVDLGAKVVRGLADMPKEQYVGTFDAAGSASPHAGAVGGGGGPRVSLGVVPDYSDDTVKGVRITGTSPGSPAEKAGLKDGDVIVQFNDRRLDNLVDLSTALAKAKPGDKVHLILLRGGKRVEADAVLVERKG